MIDEPTSQTCTDNASFRAFAEGAAQFYKTQLEQLKMDSPKITGLPIEVTIGNIGSTPSKTSATDCDDKWAEKAIGAGYNEIAMYPACGVVLKFGTKEELKAFAKALYGLPKQIYGGARVGQEWVSKSVYLCARLK